MHLVLGVSWLTHGYWSRHRLTSAGKNAWRTLRASPLAGGSASWDSACRSIFRGPGQQILLLRRCATTSTSPLAMTAINSIRVVASDEADVLSRPWLLLRAPKLAYAAAHDPERRWRILGFRPGCSTERRPRLPQAFGVLRFAAPLPCRIDQELKSCWALDGRISSAPNPFSAPSMLKSAPSNIDSQRTECVREDCHAIGYDRR